MAVLPLGEKINLYDYNGNRLGSVLISSEEEYVSKVLFGRSWSSDKVCAFVLGEYDGRAAYVEQRWEFVMYTHSEWCTSS